MLESRVRRHSRGPRALIRDRSAPVTKQRVSSFWEERCTCTQPSRVSGLPDEQAGPRSPISLPPAPSPPPPTGLLFWAQSLQGAPGRVLHPTGIRRGTRKGGHNPWATEHSCGTRAPRFWDARSFSKHEALSGFLYRMQIRLQQTALRKTGRQLALGRALLHKGQSCNSLHDNRFGPALTGERPVQLLRPPTRSEIGDGAAPPVPPPDRLGR